MFTTTPPTDLCCLLPGSVPLLPRGCGKLAAPAGGARSLTTEASSLKLTPLSSKPTGEEGISEDSMAAICEDTLGCVGRKAGIGCVYPTEFWRCLNPSVNRINRNLKSMSRPQHQRWVWVAVESPISGSGRHYTNTIKVLQLSTSINWTMTHHSQSDIVAFYGHFLSLNAKVMWVILYISKFALKFDLTVSVFLYLQSQVVSVLSLFTTRKQSSTVVANKNWSL